MLYKGIKSGQQAVSTAGTKNDRVVPMDKRTKPNVRSFVSTIVMYCNVNKNIILCKSNPFSSER